MIWYLKEANMTILYYSFLMVEGHFFSSRLLNRKKVFNFEQNDFNVLSLFNNFLLEHS